MGWVQSFWLWLGGIGDRYGVDMYVAVFVLILVAVMVIVVRVLGGGRRR